MHLHQDRLKLVDRLIARSPLEILVQYGEIPVNPNIVKRVAMERRFFTQLERFNTAKRKPNILAQLLDLMFKTQAAKQEFAAYYIVRFKYPTTV